MEEYLFPELEQQHDVGKECENRKTVSPSGQLQEHQDVHLNILLEERRDEEVHFRTYLAVLGVLKFMFCAKIEVITEAIFLVPADARARPYRETWQRISRTRCNVI